MKKSLYYIILFIVSTLLTACAHHPAQTDITSYQQQSPPRPIHNLAVLLPLTGPYANIGIAVRNGMLAAYYQSQAQEQANIQIQIQTQAQAQPQVLALENDDITQTQIGDNTPPQQQTLQFFDTHQLGGAASAYQNAIQSGADAVIGPLTKDDVQTIVETQPITVPTLTLNTLPNQPNNAASPLNPNLYEFSLNPSKQAAQIASKAQSLGLTAPLVIAPDTDWGHTMTDAINNTWQTQAQKWTQQEQQTQEADNAQHQQPTQPTNNPITLLYKPNHLAQQIEQTLGVTDSVARTRALESVIHRKVRLIPRRRQDIDVILIATSSHSAHQIVPLLKFYYAGNIPTFATSTLISQTQTIRQNHDLDGVVVETMPWLINSTNNLTPSLAALKNDTIQSLSGPRSRSQANRLKAGHNCDTRKSTRNILNTSAGAAGNISREGSLKKLCLGLSTT